jgi:branched-subunit amino acid transport protein
MDELWALTAACAAATYLSRGLGVLLAGRISVESRVFTWIACVAYAMVAGLIVRTIIMPGGMLAETFLFDRMAACTVGLAVYLGTRRNLIIGVVAGVSVLIAAGYLRAAFA